MVDDSNFEEVYPQLFPARQPIEDVYAFIISDLESAIDDAPSATEKYRANIGAAYALLAKVYATQPTPDWDQVISYSDLAINQGYTMLSDYDFLFDGAHEGNSESIWEVNGNASNIWAWGTFMFVGTDWKKFNTPSNDLVEDFDDSGDTVRKASSITFSNVSWSDTYWSSSNFPFANKMRLTDGLQNIYLLRLPDILLLKAEAAAQNGDLTTAATLTNQVRSRVSLSDLSFSSQSDALDTILHERKLELAFEGHRWFDLKRNGKAISILSQQKDGDGNILSYAANINENRLLWPIPQAQMDKNSNLTQNAGY